MSENQETETFIGGSHEGKLDWTILGLACLLFVGMLMTTLAFPFYSGQPFHPTEQSKAEAEFKALMDSLPVTTVQDIRANRAREERRKEEIVRLHDEQVAAEQTVRDADNAQEDITLQAPIREGITHSQAIAILENMEPAKVAIRNAAPGVTECQSLVYTVPAKVVLIPKLLPANKGDVGSRYSEKSWGVNQGSRQVATYLASHPELHPEAVPCDVLTSDYSEFSVSYKNSLIN